MNNEQAMDLLKDVSKNDTVWSTVYNQSTGEIQIAMGKNYEHVNEFSLKMKGKK